MLLYTNDECITSLLEKDNISFSIQLHEKNTNSFFYVLTTTISNQSYPCIRMKLNHLCEIGQPSTHKTYLKKDTVQDLLFIFANEQTMNDYLKHCEQDISTEQYIFKI